MADFNEKIIEEFHANKGKVEGPFSSMKLLLLHSIGAKSGKLFIKPLAYTKDGDNFVIVASKGGAPTNPDWYHNLLANPEITIEVDDEKLSVMAKLADGEERERLFSQHANHYPGFKDYKTKTTRVLPVFVLEKI